ncbi:MAG: WhiB family transcriptional regulator [Rhodococcus sp. (in: high G+C Gram-positive bacteria)]|uniref:WhiB family transcriptional regulator n=1 Tax=Rhodococcus sp. TaxID=1831 RepID=UPI002AD7358C|nr:WhiB family transcriptional regulator [Rhodococcus sp. (in: high G+C Gram-positive bacteria)]
MNSGEWSWQRQAQCRSMDTEFFFTYDGEPRGARLRRERAAKQVCVQCSVQDQCRSHALAVGEHGIWGGTSELDRRRFSLSSTLA